VIDSHCHFDSVLVELSVVYYEACVVNQNVDVLEIIFDAINKFLNGCALR